MTRAEANAVEYAAAALKAIQERAVALQGVSGNVTDIVALADEGLESLARLKMD